MNDSKLCSRGIRNVSKVACHIACAVQILCHAIPTVRFALRRIVDEGKREDEESDAILGNNLNSSSTTTLLDELLDFLRILEDYQDGNGNDPDCERERQSHNQCDDEPSVARQPPWNPQRLYKFLRQKGGALSLDSNNVGDATRSLSCLLCLLSREGAPCGSEWKRLLDASVWEGETRQILEGRRLITGVTGSDEDADGAHADDGDGIPIVERRFLQRIKPALMNKPMPSPLVLKFRDPEKCANATDTIITNRNNSIGAPILCRSNNTNCCGWSVIKALNEVVESQTMQGSSYPWESISPDTYSEREIVCRDYQKFEDCTNDSDSDSDSTSSSSSESENDDHSSSSECDDINMNWITSKRIEIRCIPRVWLLHLDRPRVSINKLRRLSSQEKNCIRPAQQQNEERNFEEPFWLFDHVHVPVELTTLSIVTKNKDGDGDTGSNGCAKNCRVGNVPKSNENTDELSSPTSLYLQGAIVQVLEIDENDGENEEDWEGGHSVTLLQNPNGNEPNSWLLVDDDSCQPISEKRASRMMGGVLETCRHTQDESNDNDGGMSSWTYFASSLLVYSVPENDSNKEWMQRNDDLVSSWKEHRVQLAAIIKTEESIVGKRLRIQWAKGKFYAGTITQYDSSTRKHQVTYDDGDVKYYNLAKKAVEWIDRTD